MMKPDEFDSFAANYRQIHSQNIGASGESPEFFSHYKVHDVYRYTKSQKIEPARILDFGCGVGGSIPHFQTFFPGAEITGVDVSLQSLQIARKQFENERTSFSQFNGARFKEFIEPFDLIFSACVFHHIPEEDHVPLLAELKRIACPGATLAIFEHNPFNPLTVRAVNTCPFDENAKLISAYEMGKRIVRAGWSKARRDYRIFFPSFLSALRPLEYAMTKVPFGAQYSIFATNN